MDVRILEAVDYEKIARILYESHVPQWGAIGSPEWNPNYVEYLDEAYFQPRKSPYVGAFDGDALVGIGAGFITMWAVSDWGIVPAMKICNFGVLPKYQRRGIATAMVSTLVNEASERDLKLVYRICRDELYDHLVLTKCGFNRKIRNVHHIVRIMGSDMIDRLARLKGMGKAMKLLLKIVAGMPKDDDRIEKGLIRNGGMSDVAGCVKILNAYQNTMPITRSWIEGEFGQSVEMASVLKPPFNPFFYVWEIKGEIQAFIIGRVESIAFKNGVGNAVGIIDTGFADDLLRTEKTSFIVSCLFKLKEKVPDAFGINLVVAHHEKKAFEKAGFTNDRSSRPLYVKVLSNELKDWIQADWKYKKYYIPYQR